MKTSGDTGEVSAAPVGVLRLPRAAVLPERRGLLVAQAAADGDARHGPVDHVPVHLMIKYQIQLINFYDTTQNATPPVERESKQWATESAQGQRATRRRQRASAQLWIAGSASSGMPSRWAVGGCHWQDLRSMRQVREALVTSVVWELPEAKMSRCRTHGVTTGCKIWSGDDASSDRQASVERCNGCAADRVGCRGPAHRR